jgi:REP element-mobilizing transposase RayT
MTKFQNKYRIESTRLRGWDYSNPGLYFVTIVTRDRFAWFGKIVNGAMVLSPSGEIVAEEWQKTAVIRPAVHLDAWVVMPDHVHGIIIKTAADDGVETPRRGVSTPRRGVSTVTPNNWQPNSLGSIVNQFKSICTKRIRAAGYTDFAWQSRFYDHIIRNEKSLENIRKYIVNNPTRWDLDDHHR